MNATKDMCYVAMIAMPHCKHTIYMQYACLSDFDKKKQNPDFDKETKSNIFSNIFSTTGALVVVTV